jgi:hypothetical protein
MQERMLKFGSKMPTMMTFEKEIFYAELSTGL